MERGLGVVGRLGEASSREERRGEESGVEGEQRRRVMGSDRNERGMKFTLGGRGNNNNNKNEEN